MTKQLLIYERAIPLSSEHHRSMYVKTGTDYRFAEEVNAVPILAPEFANTALHYVIVFAGEDDVMPAVLLGVRNGQNLFLQDDGSWGADYVPAFIRQYPFVVSSREGEDKFTLCIDDSYAGCNEEGRGERLFDVDGEQTSYLKQLVAWSGEYQGQFRRTKTLCAKLRELDLLVPMHARMRMDSGEEVVLSGFMTIDRARLQALSGDQLAELMAEGQLELIYLHLQSLQNLAKLAARKSDDAPRTSETDVQANGEDKAAESKVTLQ